MMSGLKINPAVIRGLLCVVLFTLCSPAPSLAAECFPYCDYNHYYGPYDFTYVKPGLYGYPTCGPRGYCLPWLTYSVAGRRPRGNIEVRTVPRPWYRVPQ